MDINKNPLLFKSFGLGVVPAFIIYKNGHMQWKGQGNHEIKSLLRLITLYL